jgi:peptide deformylase
VLPIVQTGDPVLRQVARLLTREELPSFADLVVEMRDTMRAAPGVGLAAPQIGQSIQLTVIEDLPEHQDPSRERTGVPFHVLVNPTLSFVGDETIDAFEGCLSFTGFLMGVRRARHVHVEALDELGSPVVIDASGWYARILQHEIDHLHGVLCCDRMDPRTLTTVDNHARFSR